MKKSKLTGWQKVFSFTFLQTIKTPAVLVSTVIFFLVALLALPISALINGTDEDELKTETSVSRLVIVDETELNLKDWLDLRALEDAGPLPETITFSEEEEQTLVDALAEEQDEDWAMVKVSFSEEDMLFSVIGTYGAKTGVSKSDISDLAELVGSALQEQMVEQLGISPDQIDYINHSVEEQVAYYQTENEDGEPAIVDEEEPEEQDGALSGLEYSVVLICLVLVSFMVSMSGEQVATAVIQEKSSKVVEYLLMNVRPLALMVGKVLAIFVITLGQLVLMALGFVGSAGLYILLHPGKAFSAAEVLTQMMGSSELGGAEGLGLHLGTLPMAIILILAGTLFYSTIAALMGACVSRMEEMTESMKMFSLLMVISAYGGLAVVVMDLTGNAPAVLKYVVELLPITAPFLTPGYLLLGHASIWVGILAVVIFVLALTGLFMFSANVYETLIYHKGNPLKISDLLRINKEARGNRQ
jgi:ABC-2 type transport system permease protein